MTELPDKPRLFVAVELDENVLRALGELQAQLKGLGLNGLRWVRPEGIHLTLKFLGETPREKLRAISEALSRSTAGVPPHELTLGKVGTFGSRNSPRVLWVDLEDGVEEIRRLQAQVERELAPLGFPPEDRGFSPHLTLARVRPESARALAGPLAEAVAAVKAPRAIIHVAELSLMLSKMGPGGSVYTRLEGFPLTG